MINRPQTASNEKGNGVWRAAALNQCLGVSVAITSRIPSGPLANGPGEGVNTASIPPASVRIKGDIRSIPFLAEQARNRFGAGHLEDLTAHAADELLQMTPALVRIDLSLPSYDISHSGGTRDGFRPRSAIRYYFLQRSLAIFS
jgi:hypothetical protein